MSISLPTAATAEAATETNRTKSALHATTPLALPAVQRLVTLPVVMRTESSFGRYWRKVGLIMAKDLRIEWRAKEIIVIMIAFSALAVIIFGMAFDLRVPRATMVAPGVLWGVLLFSGTLGLNRSFSTEADQQTLTALLLAPLERSALYVGKVGANLLFMLTMLVVLIPTLLFIFDVNLFQPWILIALLMGALGYVGVGTLFAALTASIRARESLLPILLLPVMAPVFMAGLKITESTLDGRDWTHFQHWLGMLLAFDLLFLTTAFLVFDLIWEDL
ncbi:MAG: heme exporter protein CcmB [Caldilineaceae bacterium]|nr:heme exporter protein CcmB [Caldilineaceae bacterium]